MDTLELFGYLTSKYNNKGGQKAVDIIDYTMAYIEITGQKQIKVKEIYESATKTIGNKKRFSYVYFINILKTKWNLEKVNNTLILNVDDEVDECYMF